MPTGGYNGEWCTSPFWTAPGQINDPPAPMPASYFGLDQQAQALLEKARMSAELKTAEVVQQTLFPQGMGLFGSPQPASASSRAAATSANSPSHLDHWRGVGSLTLVSSTLGF